MGMQEFSQILKQKREAMHISQTHLAELVHVTSQAVSKWECGRSFPDMETLCRLADYFEISLDCLWGRNIGVPEISLLPDDGRLRILQCSGKRVLTQNEYDPNVKIPLQIEDCTNTEISLEIWGSAEIDGDIAGDVGAGGSITCANIGGDVAAALGIVCGNVAGDVTAGEDVTGGNIGGGVTAGEGVVCGNVKGDLIAVGNVVCQNVRCDVSANGTISCGDIHGDVTCDADIYCQSIGGNIGDARIIYLEKQ